MSEVSFKNIELPLEQKLLFIYLFHFISVVTHLWLICERETLYECYSNYEVMQSIMTYSRWSRLPMFMIRTLTLMTSPIFKLSNSENVSKRNFSTNNLTSSSAAIFKQSLKQKKANTASSFPTQTFLCCYSGSYASGSSSTDCSTSFSTNSSRSVESEIIASP